VTLLVAQVQSITRISEVRSQKSEVGNIMAQNPTVHATTDKSV
jgi:hypothetical protein